MECMSFYEEVAHSFALHAYELNVEIDSLGSALHFAGVWMQFASYAQNFAEVNIAPPYCHVVLGTHILTKKYLYLLLRVFWL